SSLLVRRSCPTARSTLRTSRSKKKFPRPSEGAADCEGSGGGHAARSLLLGHRDEVTFRSRLSAVSCWAAPSACQGRSVFLGRQDGGNTMSKLRILTATALVTALAVSAGYAQQQQQTQRLAGTIDKVEGGTIVGKGRDGSAVTIKLPDNVVVTAVFKATVADIKPGAYIGSGAVPQADGSQKAVEVHIFAESMRGQGDGHRPGWYGAPNGTMTNGAVEPTGTVSTVGGPGGEPSFVVKYKEGEKRIVVPANAHIVRYEVGSKDDLK